MQPKPEQERFGHDKLTDTPMPKSSYTFGLHTL